MRAFLALAVTLALTGATVGAEAPARKLKVYVSVDMEGISGTVTSDQLGPEAFEYARFREFMTREALAAVQAAGGGRGRPRASSATATATARTCSSSSSRPT